MKRPYPARPRRRYIGHDNGPAANDFYQHRHDHEHPDHAVTTDLIVGNIALGKYTVTLPVRGSGRRVIRRPVMRPYPESLSSR